MTSSPTPVGFSIAVDYERFGDSGERTDVLPSAVPLPEGRDVEQVAGILSTARQADVLASGAGKQLLYLSRRALEELRNHGIDLVATDVVIHDYDPNGMRLRGGQSEVGEFFGIDMPRLKDVSAPTEKRIFCARLPES